MATNTDFRVAVGFFRHPKVRLLARTLGELAVLALLRLYGYVAENRPRGTLENLSHARIAIAADWEGDADAFVNALLEVGLLDQADGVLSIHDWKEHNGYCYHSPDRSEQAKKAVNSRADRRGRSKAQSSAESSTQPRDQYNSATDESYYSPSAVVPDAKTSSSPSPSPDPTPSPDPNRNPAGMIDY